LEKNAGFWPEADADATLKGTSFPQLQFIARGVPATSNFLKMQGNAFNQLLAYCGEN